MIGGSSGCGLRLRKSWSLWELLIFAQRLCTLELDFWKGVVAALSSYHVHIILLGKAEPLLVCGYLL